MERIIVFVVLCLAIFGCAQNKTLPLIEENYNETLEETKMKLDGITWLGHASFMFIDENTGNKIYYIDPFEIEQEMNEKADIIFITHAHQDHCSPDSIKKIIKNETTIVAANKCDINNLTKNIMLVEPNKEYEVKGFKFRTIPAYNTAPEKQNFHPKNNKWVGYILEINGQKIYHAGDTDFIPEMKNLGKIDIAMIPIGGTYTMDYEEAIEAANTINASVTIPMHYRRLNPTNYSEIEKKFVEGVKGKVVILDEQAE